MIYRGFCPINLYVCAQLQGLYILQFVSRGEHQGNLWIVIIFLLYDIDHKIRNFCIYSKLCFTFFKPGFSFIQFHHVRSVFMVSLQHLKLHMIIKLYLRNKFTKLSLIILISFKFFVILLNTLLAQVIWNCILVNMNHVILE